MWFSHQRREPPVNALVLLSALGPALAGTIGPQPQSPETWEESSRCPSQELAAAYAEQFVTKAKERYCSLYAAIAATASGKVAPRQSRRSEYHQRDFVYSRVRQSILLRELIAATRLRERFVGIVGARSMSRSRRGPTSWGYGSAPSTSQVGFGRRRTYLSEVPNPGSQWTQRCLSIRTIPRANLIRLRARDDVRWPRPLQNPSVHTGRRWVSRRRRLDWQPEYNFFTVFIADAACLTVRVTDLATHVAGCEFQAPQKGLRLINVNAISFMP
jgi:hypothetical protein